MNDQIREILTMEELFRCSLPITSEHEFEGFEASMGGTCFVVHYKTKYFVLTAKHILKNKRLNPHEIRIFDSQQDDCRTLCLTHLIGPFSINDAKDIVVFEMDPASKQFCKPLDLDKFYPENVYTPESILTIRGFPDSISDVNYENKTMLLAGYYTTGREAGLSTSDFCRKIKFDDLSGVDDINGMSGSPLFHFIKDGENSYLYNFAGMLIRGSKLSMEGHFMEAKAIYEFLDIACQICDQNNRKS